MQDDSVTAVSITAKKSLTVPTITVGSNITMQDSIVTTTNLNCGALYGGVDNAGATTNALAITTASTIAVDAGTRIQCVKPGATTTSCDIATAANDGQEITIVNVGSVVVSFATGGNIAGGALTIATSAAMGFVWHKGLSLWFHRG